MSDCSTKESNEDFTVQINSNNDLFHKFDAQFSSLVSNLVNQNSDHALKHYKIVTWIVSSAGKILSVITVNLDKHVANDGELFTVVNKCSKRSKGSCETSLFVKEAGLTMQNETNYDVTICFTGRGGKMRGCEVKNMIFNGL